MNDTTKGMCFLGMPCGRSAAERLAYRQWRKEVLEPAIDGAGYTPWVSELDATASRHRLGYFWAASRPR